MKRGSTLFLKLTLVVMGLPVLAVVLQLGVEVSLALIRGEPLPFVVWGLFAVLSGSSVPYFTALRETWRLLVLIDRREAFSELAIRALRNIRRCAVSVAVLFALGLPVFAAIARMEDAPGLSVIGMAVVGLSIVIAVFAAVLGHLLKQAISIRVENEFTV
ncbi:hypothetical protein AV656_11500 [Bhargavaea cecembensis]|uniref:DUF2975 domain-containing protein n=1 Tax=Bhargavaea cecembensis TaxID=394098 RepID=A0A163EU99_9BACL|nr:DUF2975 domain-containing protein [Bhargavaea cecembensis]KZE37197.1 hypothetical protein AV656_11500 [Bhargavaea cecembensis]